MSKDEIGNYVTSDGIEYGSREHATAVTKGRHPAVCDGLQWLTFTHLPLALQAYSRPFYVAACVLISRITTDSPELTTSINRLIDAKDSGMRAGIRHSSGRAGSVPRPPVIVAPPTLSSGTPGPAEPQLG